MKRAFILMALVLPMLAAGLTPLALAQGNPTNITQTVLPESSYSKTPRIDTLGSDVYVAGNADRAVERLWRKADTATSFPSPTTIAPTAGSMADYYTAAIYVSDTGVIYYAWINQDERRIYVRLKTPTDTDFRAASLAYGASTPFNIEVAANEDGVFIFWREGDGPINYRRSPDGVSWLDRPVQGLNGEISAGIMDIAAGSGRNLAIAYYRGQENFLQCFLGIWNGSSFTIERVPTATTTGFASPSVALRPDGGWAVAMEGVDPNEGVYVTDRLPNGAWDSVVRIIRGKIFGVAVDVDPYGNAHLFWSTDQPGRPTIYYAYRRPGQAYGGIALPQQPVSSPLTVFQHNDLLFGPAVAASLRDRSYGHVVLERFNGGVTSLQYALVGLPVTLVGASGISIEGGAATTNKSTVSVAFSGLTGSPTEVRWSWGGPPAASAAYGAFDPANPTLSVPLPAGVSPNCTPLTLYTQLRSGLYSQLAPSSDSIVVDQAVQADFNVLGNAPALDPRYTATLNPTVLVFSAADCSGLATTTVSGPIEGDSLSLPVAGKPLYVQPITLTGGPGAKELSFVATDLAGNATSPAVTRTIIYDPEPPTLTSLAPESASTILPDPNGTAELSLSLENLVASDSGGILAGIELQIVNPGGKTSDPIRIPFSQMDQVITNPDASLSLRDTIALTDFFAPADLVAGTYSFVIRVVDGAGNASPSSQNVTRSEPLPALTFPTYAPFVRR